MITSREEYLKHLAQIERARDALYFIPIPEAEKIYKIDLNTRRVEAPALLSVTEDHEAEIVFFEMDRFYDKKDMTHTTCVISYITPDGVSHVYAVPCMDIVTKRVENKVIIPWVIESAVTWVAGPVKFSFKFFELNPGTLEYTYQLNTLTSVTKVGSAVQLRYVKASDRAAQDYKDGKWSKVYGSYFVKVYGSTGHSRYERASVVYNPGNEYYMREDEYQINSATKLDEIWTKLQTLSRGGVKWVEI